MYKNLNIDITLRAEDVDRLRLLLDSEIYRIRDVAPFAFDEPTSYASAIDRLRNQFIYIQDSNLAPAPAGDTQ